MMQKIEIEFLISFNTVITSLLITSFIYIVIHPRLSFACKLFNKIREHAGIWCLYVG